MNEGDLINFKHGVQIITTIPEISSINHSHNQTTDKNNNKDINIFNIFDACHEILDFI
jgi:hypothetical protein